MFKIIKLLNFFVFYFFLFSYNFFLDSNTNFNSKGSKIIFNQFYNNYCLVIVIVLDNKFNQIIEDIN